jgi:DNA-binding CsgD family transcriptional regulator
LERLEKMSLGIKVPETVEYEVLNKKGQRLYLQLHNKNIYDAEGNVIASDVVAHDITERKQAEEELKRFAKNLEDANTAMRVLMNRRDEDRKEIEDKLQTNIKNLVIPYLKMLNHASLDNRYKHYLNVLENNLKEVLSPFMKNILSLNKNLTPQEIQIVDLIKQGKNTKEIAGMLNASPNTIATHRNNIREKLNLRNAKVNLRSYLQSLS